MVKFLISLSAFILFFSDCLYSRDLKIYFFNPDANLKNISLINAKFNESLGKAKKGLIFQPFEVETIIMKEIEANKPDFILCSQSFFEANKKQFNLTPLLQPTINGKKEYRKIIISKKELNLSRQESLKMACTKNGENTREFLQNKLFSETEIKISTFKLMEVNKDIDAVFALVFNQVDISLVTQESFKSLNDLNPVLLKGVKTIYTTKEIPLPFLCAFKNNVTMPEINEVRSVFLNIGAFQEGTIALSILGYDKFIEVKD